MASNFISVKDAKVNDENKRLLNLAIEVLGKIDLLDPVSLPEAPDEPKGSRHLARYALRTIDHSEYLLERRSQHGKVTLELGQLTKWSWPRLYEDERAAQIGKTSWQNINLRERAQIKFELTSVYLEIPE